MFQIADFSSINDLKFTYASCLQFQNFFPGVIPPDPHYKGEGGEGKGGEVKGGEGRGGEGREGGERRGGEGSKDGMR
jgi:hypothetical protein